MKTAEFTPKSVALLGAATIMMGINPSILILMTFSLFIEPIAADIHWSHAAISGLVSLLALSIAITSPLKGWVVDRWGASATLWMLAPGLAATFLAIASTGADRPVLLYAGFAILGLFAPGNVPFGKVIAEWFSHRRGLAYGIFGFGMSLVTILGLQVCRPLIDAAGWRGAFAAIGLLQIGLGIPLLLFVFRDRPAQAAAAPVSGPQPRAEGATIRQALRSPTYWLVVGNLVLGVFAMMGLMTQGVPLLAEKGIARTNATNILSALSLGLMIAQPLLGLLLDRFRGPRIVFPFAAAAVVGLIVLKVSTNEAVCFVAMFVIGLGAGGESGITPYLVSQYFGLRSFSVIYGLIQPINLGLAVAAGAWLLGALYDRTGSYSLDLDLMIAAAALAALFLLILRPFGQVWPDESHDVVQAGELDRSIMPADLLTGRA